MHLATENAGIEVLAVLLEAGAHVNAIALPRNCTPLDLAIERVEVSGLFYFESAALLVEHGASFSHWKPHKLVQKCAYAVTHGLECLVELYLDNDCNPNGRVVRSSHLLL